MRNDILTKLEGKGREDRGKLKKRVSKMEMLGAPSGFFP
jgi:hypothetical protein